MGMPKASRTFFGQYDVGTYIRQNLGGVNAPDEFIQRYPFAEYLIFHMISTALICGVLMALIVVLLYRLLGWIGVGERERLIVLAIYAFGTITFFYATRLYSHVPSTFFVFSAFVLLFAIRHRGLNGSWPIPWYVCLDGICFGAGASCGRYLWSLGSQTASSHDSVHYSGDNSRYRIGYIPGRVFRESVCYPVQLRYSTRRYRRTCRTHRRLGRIRITDFCLYMGCHFQSL